MAIFQSCEQNSYFSNSQDCQNYDYSDCNTSEPALVALHIKLTINDENPKVPVTIYEGKLDNNLIVLTDTVSASTYSVLLPPDKYYTVSARYVSGNKIIYGIGSDNIKKIRNYVCDSVCWTEQEGNIDVRLKGQKD
ncbi:MAG TPA: hypothetical protein PKW80_03615 [Bacteroidales bacterium]|nr:hypothetical protein [Bacteroidales bacterium]